MISLSIRATRLILLIIFIDLIPSIYLFSSNMHSNLLKKSLLLFHHCSMITIAGKAIMFLYKYKGRQPFQYFHTTIETNAKVIKTHVEKYCTSKVNWTWNSTLSRKRYRGFLECIVSYWKIFETAKESSSNDRCWGVWGGSSGSLIIPAGLWRVTVTSSEPSLWKSPQSIPCYNHQKHKCPGVLPVPRNNER